MYFLSSRARGVERESAQEAEAVQHSTVSGQCSHALVILLLIEVKAGFVTLQQVRPKAQSIELDLQVTLSASVEDGIGVRKPFKLPGADIVPFQDSTWFENRSQR